MTGDRPFHDRARKPGARALATALADVTDLFEELQRIADGFRTEWTYSKTSGWMLKVHDGKKALFYAVPLAREFRVTLTVRPRERDRMLKDADLAALHEPLRVAKRYAEGYALRFDVSGRPSFAPVARLVERIIDLRRSS